MHEGIAIDDGITFAEVIALNVRVRRHERGWTQADLAARARVSLRTLSALERGARANPKGNTVDRVARALEVSARDLMVVSAPACERCGATCPTCASRILSARLVAAAERAP